MDKEFDKKLDVLIIYKNDYDIFGGVEKILLHFLEFIKSNYSYINIEFCFIKNSKISFIKKYSKEIYFSYFLQNFKNYSIKIHNIYKTTFRGFGLLNLFFKDLLGLDLLYDYKDLFNFIRNKKYNVIIILNNPFYLNSVSKVIKDLSYNVKIFYWDHGVLNSYKYLYSQKFFKIIENKRKKEIEKGIKNIDNYLCISRGIERIIKEINPKAKTYLVYNPIEIPKEPKLIPRGENNVLLYVGRLEDKEKNISFMLKGLSKLKEIKWELRIIGVGPDEKKLKKLSKKLGIEYRIKWEGFKKDPYENLEEVKVLLLTSRLEGFGLVLVEGNVRGIPFLSSNCSGPEDIVIEGINGYLYQEGNMEDFINKLRKILINELNFADPYEIHKTSYRFEKSKILHNIIDILIST
jgi:UDP-D-galactose:(glucosyl)LPS alpha-1,6-D-galactosyltransferase